MFNKKIKQEIEFLKLQVESQTKALNENWKYIQELLDAKKQNQKDLKLQVESQTKALNENWKYIQALLDAEKQNRKDLNTVISKINQMKTKGKK